MTDNHPLYGAHLRFQRADIHLSEADKLIRAFSKTCKNNIVSDNDYKTIRFEFAEIPLLLPLVVSDAIHNLRAALDYIVYELAILDSGKVQNGTQFLIEDIKSDPVYPKRGFDGRKDRCLVGLNPVHIDMIEALQPYKRVEWTKTLRDLSNPDKHRTLTTLTTTDRRLGVRIDYRPSGQFRGAEKLTPEGITYDSYDIEIDGTDAIGIAGTDPSAPSLMGTLRRLEAEVCRTIELFKPEFPA